eukprot:2355925-Rhodomonas_salina.1
MGMRVRRGEEQGNKKRKLQSSLEVEGGFEYVECPAFLFTSKRKRFNLLVGITLDEEERLCRECGCK